jgi:hypothetical protein
MNSDSNRLARRVLAHRRRRWIMALLIASVGGCGPATDERELPAEAKQALAKKKVDVQPRPSKQATPRR